MADGSEPDTLNGRIRAVLAETLGLDAADVPDDASSDTLEGWDSLAHQNLLLALGKAFAITFSAEEGARIKGALRHKDDPLNADPEEAKSKVQSRLAKTGNGTPVVPMPST